MLGYKNFIFVFILRYIEIVLDGIGSIINLESKDYDVLFFDKYVIFFLIVFFVDVLF